MIAECWWVWSTVTRWPFSVGGLLLFSLFWSITSFRFCVSVLAIMSARSWHKYLVSLLGAFQVGQIDSMAIAGTLSGSKFFCYDSTGTPVEKGQGNSFSCCASPWRPPSISSQHALKPIDLLHFEPPGSPLRAVTRQDTQIKRNQHTDKGKALQERKVLQWSTLNIFFHLCFCCWAISFLFPVWYKFYHLSNINC